MIILNESISDPLLIEPIKQWYKGDVLPIRRLRPATVIKDTVIKDDAMPILLRQVSHPTFITINVDDFWRKTDATRSFCIVAIALKQDRAIELPSLLRCVFQTSEFHTKAKRMGKVIL